MLVSPLKNLAHPKHSIYVCTAHVPQGKRHQHRIHTIIDTYASDQQVQAPTDTHLLHAITGASCRLTAMVASMRALSADFFMLIDVAFCTRLSRLKLSAISNSFLVDSTPTFTAAMKHGNSSSSVFTRQQYTELGARTGVGVDHHAEVVPVRRPRCTWAAWMFFW